MEDYEDVIPEHKIYYKIMEQIDKNTETRFILVNPYEIDLLEKNDLNIMQPMMIKIGWEKLNPSAIST